MVRRSWPLLLAIAATSALIVLSTWGSPPAPALSSGMEPERIVEADPHGLFAGAASDSGGAALVASRVTVPPEIDGEVEDAWESAGSAMLPLTWGMRGTEMATSIELRAMYTEDAVFFLARWPGGPPPAGADVHFNKLTLHWTIEPANPDAPPPACAVSCHTAYVSGSGRILYANAETIPPGGYPALRAAGGWRDGQWTVEWARPLLNGNPYDLQFSDLGSSYPFFVKLFERIDGRPDPVSAEQHLVFSP